MTLTSTEIAHSQLVETAVKFWFSDHDHIRSPFPEYIHTRLERKSSERFEKWLSNLEDKAKDEINEVIMAEKFEEILFEEGLLLVLTEDEKITVNYPFLPRLNDELKANPEDSNSELSTVVDRALHKEKDQVFLELTLEKQNSKEKWNTRFELPA